MFPYQQCNERFDCLAFEKRDRAPLSSGGEIRVGWHPLSCSGGNVQVRGSAQHWSHPCPPQTQVNHSHGQLDLQLLLCLNLYPSAWQWSWKLSSEAVLDHP